MGLVGAQDIQGGQVKPVVLQHRVQDSGMPLESPCIPAYVGHPMEMLHCDSTYMRCGGLHAIPQELVFRDRCKCHVGEIMDNLDFLSHDHNCCHIEEISVRYQLC